MQISLGDITVDVVRKRMRSIRLSVHPPVGRVRISAPFRVAIETLRAFALAKLGWIRKQQVRVRQQPRALPREFVDGEPLSIWGHRCVLRIVEAKAPPSVELRPGELVLRVRPGTSERIRAAAIEAWHREELRKAAIPLFAKWELAMGVSVGTIFTQRMRTRWGTCNPRTRSIRLNTELVKKPPECLEYVIVHEMVHLLEPSHNRRFKTLMSQFMPAWAHLRQKLRSLPTGPESLGC